VKKGLRFIIALLLLGSLGIWFLPILQAAGTEISVVDVFAVGMGYYDRNGLEGVLYASVQTYLESYAWIIAAAAGIVVMETVFVCALRKRAPYILAIFISLINSAAFAALFVVLNDKFGEIERALISISAEGILSVSYVTLYAWLAVYALVFIFSVIGLILWRTPRERNREEIYLEQISRAEAERAHRRSASLHQPEPRREQPVRQHQPDTRHQGNQEYWNPAPFQREEEPSIWAPEEKENITPAAEAVHPQTARESAAEEFAGAIACEGGLYAGKVYPLKDKTEVFFLLKEGEAVLSPYEEEGASAGIYYIKEYGEYCAEPFEKGMLFLASGQPLGKGRQYYLPRGTKIYVSDRKNTFTLA